MSRVTLIAILLLAVCAHARSFAQEKVAPPTSSFQPADAVEGLFCDQDFCVPPPLYVSPYGTVYGSVEAVAFRRDWQPVQPIATLNTPTNTVFDTHSLNFTSEPGIRLGLGTRINARYAVEAGFVGLLKWDETRAISNLTPNSQGTNGNLFSPLTGFGNPPQLGLDYNNFVSLQITSNFNTAELNVRQRFDTPPGIMQATGVYGFRYIDISEGLVYGSRSFSPVPLGSANGVNVTTKNNMYGVQAGGAVEFRIEPRAWVNFEAKGILCYNAASEQSVYTVGPVAGPSTSFTTQNSNNRAMLGADVSGSVLWKFTPILVGRLGYQGIFLDGLALAAQNFLHNAPFIPTGPTEVYRNGHLAFHGPFVGLTATW
jgi:hypothetical protein